MTTRNYGQDAVSLAGNFKRTLSPLELRDKRIAELEAALQSLLHLTTNPMGLNFSEEDKQSAVNAARAALAK